ncbi:MAG: aldehyde dehydrogenase [Flavobacterium sp.]
MNYKTSLSFRKETLVKLLNTIVLLEDEIIQALFDDFKKPAFEAVVTETSYVLSELKDTIKNFKKWAQPKRVWPSLLNFPSSDYILREPYGKVLIIAPWNYPFQLALCPLISAVAAGNQVVLKPSELTPNTAKIIEKIIEKVFHVNHVKVEKGGISVAQKLLEQRWDYIFFTGSVPVGKIIAKAAAEHLTPVTLELGGKNPCIIDETANLKLAAKRIVWGKFINAGQTCIAPDYILIQKEMKSHFVDYLKIEITKAYGENPKASPDFARIVNQKNWMRLATMIQSKKVLIGGESDIEQCYIAPTVVEEDSMETLVMQDEIFGPILPILTYDQPDELEQMITRYEKPLALYVFTEDRSFGKEIMKKYAFGGGCINDTIIHFSNPRLPFGGVGHSGLGAYHGRLSFDVFSHKKGIVTKGNWLDIPLRYAPYKNKLNTIKKILQWL